MDRESMDRTYLESEYRLDEELDGGTRRLDDAAKAAAASAPAYTFMAEDDPPPEEPAGPSLWERAKSALDGVTFGFVPGSHSLARDNAAANLAAVPASSPPPVGAWAIWLAVGALAILAVLTSSRSAR